MDSPASAIVRAKSEQLDLATAAARDSLIRTASAETLPMSAPIAMSGELINGNSGHHSRKPSFGKKFIGSSPGRRGGSTHIRKERSAQLKLDLEDVTSGAALSRASSASLGFSFSFTGFIASPEDIIGDLKGFSDEENDFLKGCLELLSRSGVNVKGKRAGVVGRSNIVGLPVSLLLLKADATVTVVHSRTPDPENIIREADIVIAAAGQANMVPSEAADGLILRLFTAYFIYMNTAATLIKKKLIYVGSETGKLIALRNFFAESLNPLILIFVQSKERAKKLHRELAYEDIKVDLIHADRSQEERENAVDNFRVGKTWVLIATDGIARGMDFKGVNILCGKLRFS